MPLRNNIQFPWVASKKPESTSPETPKIQWLNTKARARGFRDWRAEEEHQRKKSTAAATAAAAAATTSVTAAATATESDPIIQSAVQNKVIPEGHLRSFTENDNGVLKEWNAPLESQHEEFQSHVQEQQVLEVLLLCKHHTQVLCDAIIEYMRCDAAYLGTKTLSLKFLVSYHYPRSVGFIADLFYPFSL